MICILGKETGIVIRADAFIMITMVFENLKFYKSRWCLIIPVQLIMLIFQLSEYLVVELTGSCRMVTNCL